MLLDKVRLALRITTKAYDCELDDLIQAAIADLRIAGVVVSAPQEDPLITRAIITYCRYHFGSPEQPDRLKRAYDEQKAAVAGVHRLHRLGVPECSVITWYL